MHRIVAVQARVRWRLPWRSSSEAATTGSSPRRCSRAPDARCCCSSAATTSAAPPSPSGRSRAATRGCRATRTSSRSSRARSRASSASRSSWRDRTVAAFAPYDGGALLVEQDAAGAATRASFRERTGSDADHDAFLALYDELGDAAERLFPTFLEPLPTRAEARALLGDARWIAERPLGEVLDERFGDELVARHGLDGRADRDARRRRRRRRCARTAASSTTSSAGPRWRVPGRRDGRGLGRAGGRGARGGRRPALRRRGPARRRRRGHVARRGRRAHRHRRPRARQLRAARCSTACAAGRPQADARRGAQLKVNLLLDRLPRLRSGHDPEDAFAGTFRLNESRPSWPRPARRRPRGELPERAPAELYCHSLADPSIVPDGRPHADPLRPARHRRR